MNFSYNSNINLRFKRSAAFFSYFILDIFMGIT